MLLSVSLGLAFLTRPDTVIVAVPVFVYVFFAGRKWGRGSNLSFLLAMVGWYALFIVGQELFRWGYYGEWVPNTCVLKVGGMSLISRSENGTIFVASFLKEVYVLPIVVGAGVIFAFRKAKLFLASYWRFLAPAYRSCWCWRRTKSLRPCNTSSIRRASKGPNWGFSPTLLVLGVLWSANSRFVPEIAMLREFNNVRTNEATVNTTLAIERFTTPEATVGVFHAGTISYYRGARESGEATLEAPAM